jgi:hypothetical protein
MNEMSCSQAQKELIKLGFKPLKGEHCLSPNFITHFYDVQYTRQGILYTQKQCFNTIVNVTKAQLGLD